VDVPALPHALEGASVAALSHPLATAPGTEPTTGPAAETPAAGAARGARPARAAFELIGGAVGDVLPTLLGPTAERFARTRIGKAGLLKRCCVAESRYWAPLRCSGLCCQDCVLPLPTLVRLA
jgi:hypothetical protein